MTTITKRDRKAARAAQTQAEREAARLTREVNRNRAALDEMIGETGWAVVVMTAKNLATQNPYFAYTVGLTALGMPELCAWGRDKTALKETLNMLPVYARATGQTLAGDTYLTLPDGGVLTLSKAPEDAFSEMFYARERYTFVRALVVQRPV